MTNSTASAHILTDLITKGQSPWSPMYTPSRVDIMAAGPKFIAENLNVAVNLIGGKITPVPKDVNIKKREAKIVDIDGERVGAYRDEQGILHMVDVTCTHMGCELVFNEAEKTWDCPCHGSRFSIDGENVEGPAFNSLKKAGKGKNEIDPDIF